MVRQKTPADVQTERQKEWRAESLIEETEERLLRELGWTPFPHLLPWLQQCQYPFGKGDCCALVVSMWEPVYR